MLRDSRQVDFVFPAVTRTLVQIGSCLDLGSAGWWLTVDFSVRCYDATQEKDKDYAEILPHVVGFAAIYSIGIPLAFFYLVHRYRRCSACITEGDRMRHRALSWMYEPFRLGYECPSTSVADCRACFHVCSLSPLVSSLQGGSWPNFSVCSYSHQRLASWHPTAG